MSPQSGIIWHKEKRPLIGKAGGPPHHAPNCLPKEQLSGGGSCEYRNAESGHIYAFGHHSDRHDPRVRSIGVSRDVVRRVGVVGGGNNCLDPMPIPEMLRDSLGVRLIDRDHQTACIWVVAPEFGEALVGLAQHRREPLAL